MGGTKLQVSKSGGPSWKEQCIVDGDSHSAVFQSLHKLLTGTVAAVSLLGGYVALGIVHKPQVQGLECACDASYERTGCLCPWKACWIPKKLGTGSKKPDMHSLLTGHWPAGTCVLLMFCAARC